MSASKGPVAPDADFDEESVGKSVNHWSETLADDWYFPTTPYGRANWADRRQLHLTLAILKFKVKINVMDISTTNI